jgi:hypothetical protein
MVWNNGDVGADGEQPMTFELVVVVLQVVRR